MALEEPTFCLALLVLLARGTLRYIGTGVCRPFRIGAVGAGVLAVVAVPVV